MAVKIRLMRVGKKKQPTYRVVVADARSPRDGRFIEIIGQYAPRHEPSQIQIDTERAVAWLEKGAQPTEQVAKLLDVTGVWDAFKTATGKDAAAKPKARVAKPKASPPPAPAAAPSAPEPAAEAPAEETPAAEATAPEVTDEASAPETETADAEETSE
ncbi:MAG TPA: 30S ribosomal protein S16 [Acidimicrobiia bacterium]|nr:30S ribosomal protein S16 [Acidimicrobiia bacterium]